MVLLEKPDGLASHGLMTLVMPVDDSAGEGIASVFAALSNPDRLQLLHALRDANARYPGGLTITALANKVGITRFAASRHLRVLATAGLVRAAASKTSLLHSLEPRAFEAVEDWLLGYTDHCAGDHHDG